MASEAMEQGQGGDQLQEHERERVIRKIKRCLALGSSSNPNEAETALRQARAMMDKYRLSEVDVALAEVGEHVCDLGKSRMADWEKVLVGVAAKAFRCRVIRRTGANVQLIFVGVMPAAELAAYAYDSLHAQLQLAKARFRKERPGAGARVVNDFCMAWVMGVKSTIASFAEAAPQGEAEANAMIVIGQKESAAIDRWIQNSIGKVRSHSIRGRDMDADAAARGIAAGQQARINSAMNGGSGPRSLAA